MPDDSPRITLDLLVQSLKDSRPVTLVFDGSLTVEDVGSVVVGLGELYRCLGGGSLRIGEVTFHDGAARRPASLALHPVDAPPPDELFRWTWRDRLGAWWGGRGRRKAKGVGR